MTAGSSRDCRKANVFPESVSEEIDRLVDRIRGERGAVAIAESLRGASLLIENAAYEMARHDNATQVSRLILTAAEIDRMVAQFETES